MSRPVQGTHEAVAGTVFGALRRVGLGPASRPVQVVHDGISSGVYAAVRGISHLAGRGIGVAAGLARPGEWRPITGNPTGAVITGAINGLVGDHMVALDNDLAVPMALYTSTLEDEHDALPADPEELRAAVADHPERDLGRLVLFVHGLGETEHAWRLYGEASAGEGYAERVASATGATPLLLRYNSGLPIADNGAALSLLLTDLWNRWPAEVRRLDLVGHSMGGLLLRYACHHAVETGQPWVATVRRMVYLGSPHRGAPLAHRVDQLASGLLALVALGHLGRVPRPALRRHPRPRGRGVRRRGAAARARLAPRRGRVRHQLGAPPAGQRPRRPAGARRLRGRRDRRRRSR